MWFLIHAFQINHQYAGMLQHIVKQAIRMMRVIWSVITSVYINTEKGLFVLIHSPRKSITGLNYKSLQWCVEHLKPVLSDSYGA
jgi:hypothetical protein